MARRVEGFKKDQIERPRRYDWAAWTDGEVWEIRQGEDYDVPTENMRVNLHERAKRQGVAVRTEIARDDAGEGLRFQFNKPPLRPRHEHLRVPLSRAGR